MPVTSQTVPKQVSYRPTYLKGGPPRDPKMPVSEQIKHFGKVEVVTPVPAENAKPQ